MAVGFPAKTSFTDGAVLPASDLNDITGTLNSLVPTSSLPWTTYTPTISGGWANTGATPGTFGYAKYTQIGKVVFFAFDFTIGATTTKGTTLTVSLPVTAATTATMSNIRGIASIGGTIYDMTWFGSSTSTITGAAYSATGSYTIRTGITSAIPGAWATGDIFRAQGFYEAV